MELSGSCRANTLDQDLQCWEESKITDPTSIKGMAAELAAIIGPKVMENSAMQLF